MPEDYCAPLLRQNPESAPKAGRVFELRGASHRICTLQVFLPVLPRRDSFYLAYHDVEDFIGRG